ncbi:tetratricopeptide repeat protein [Streptomyces microflavus]|uniref:tetratricopeptide repeat protein n=1 Tax=Streptomyces microflavus TaxID=1919 RepID=UPI003426D25F
MRQRRGGERSMMQSAGSSGTLSPHSGRSARSTDYRVVSDRQSTREAEALMARVTSTRRIERAGVNALRTLLEDHDQIVQEIDGGNDYGEDLFVMLTKNGQRTGMSVAIQVKSGAKYKRANGYAIPVDEHFDDWTKSLLPVFGVVFDVESKRLYWVNLSAYLKKASTPKSWVSVNVDNELDASTVGNFIDAAQEYAEEKDSRTRGEIPAQVFSVSETWTVSPDWFVGRVTQCEEITEILTATSRRRALISGIAGVGKTSLVHRVLREPSVQNTYSGSVVFLDMFGFSGDRRTLGRAGAAYAPLLTALGIPSSSVPADIGSQAVIYHKKLDELADLDTPVLLALDNVAEMSQIAELLPKSPKHGVVITSRIQLGVIDGIENVNLQAMSAIEARALLSASLMPKNMASMEAHRIDTLCTLCGRLPLAVKIAAAILKGDLDLDIDGLIEELEEESNRLNVLQYGDTAVRAALEVSYRHLDEELREPFFRLSVNPGSEISTEIAAVVMEVAPLKARGLMRRLSESNLVSRSPVPARWVMHDLVYLFSSEKAKELMSASSWISCFTELAHCYYVTAEESDGRLRGPISSARGRFQTTADSLQWFDIECENLVGTAQRASDLGLHEDAYFISMNLVLYFDMRGRVVDALQSAILAHDSARVSKNAEWQVRALNNIGLALTTQRKFKEAIQRLTKAQVIAERIGFFDGACEAAISLGAAVRQYQGPTAAIPLLTEALRLAEQTGVTNAIATALTNLGSAYRESGQLGNAAKVLEKSIALHQMTGDLRKEASAHGGLGAVYSNMGKCNLALKAFEKSFAAYESVQDEFGIHLGFMNLGATYLSAGDQGKATRCLERARVYFSKTRNSYYEAGTLANLGRVEHEAGNPRKARQLYERARDLYAAAAAPDELQMIDHWLRKLDA